MYSKNYAIVEWRFEVGSDTVRVVSESNFYSLFSRLISKWGFQQLHGKCIWKKLCMHFNFLLYQEYLLISFSKKFPEVLSYTCSIITV